MGPLSIITHHTHNTHVDFFIIYHIPSYTRFCFIIILNELEFFTEYILYANVITNYLDTVYTRMLRLENGRHIIAEPTLLAGPVNILRLDLTNQNHKMRRALVYVCSLVFIQIISIMSILPLDLDAVSTQAYRRSLFDGDGSFGFEHSSLPLPDFVLDCLPSPFINSGELRLPLGMDLESLQMHGTTTLSFKFSKGIIVAADSR